MRDKCTGGMTRHAGKVAYTGGYVDKGIPDTLRLGLYQNFRLGHSQVLQHMSTSLTR